ncbi:hypothetical protein HMPREF1054_1718 [Haemophilus paraphrohaemolyticus HK411]|uniref:Uncharacterized protein n=1 Tax=Haemophilus paraphrohaemolyticus HK411 TaxID=1095743 RepID=I2NHC1_9PAST|nr:hypothetical protein HMPREF1054_1718 [Haemophilus paraphrohaemolyticus HK411]
MFLAGFVPKVVSLDSATERCVPCEFAIQFLHNENFGNKKPLVSQILTSGYF